MNEKEKYIKKYFKNYIGNKFDLEKQLIVNYKLSVNEKQELTMIKELMKNTNNINFKFGDFKLNRRTVYINKILKYFIYTNKSKYLIDKLEEYSLKND